MSELSTSFTSDHLDGYFERIELPSRFRREQNPKFDREFLATIQAYHVSHIPYDNTALHYSPTPSISLHIHDIFHKLVTRKRGGYCMENNILLYHVLRQLGFDVYLTGARLYRDANNPKPGWSGCNEVSSASYNHRQEKWTTTEAHPAVRADLPWFGPLRADEAPADTG
ncbi:cysteine proteinase [Aspergillus costaricaensis CBS 115574]|uniref:Cysteine proteinase n=1 Tax=Aspergillus costaricaensis CBS 115574 TaxID=1448317 RepID=A0ACD1I623_9EURO|nr:cysteine proteinase [Aspergillus costaricaensis CBS 115574]RAK85209.1 cysteine proteinase [Aspergillus costaricaensis CBS 115574]